MSHQFIVLLHHKSSETFEYRQCNHMVAVALNFWQRKEINRQGLTLVRINKRVSSLREVERGAPGLLVAKTSIPRLATYQWDIQLHWLTKRIKTCASTHVKNGFECVECTIVLLFSKEACDHQTATETSQKRGCSQRNSVA